MMNIPARYGFPSFAAALAAVFLATASSCCATGECLDAEMLTTFRPGQTNILEIRDVLGPPKYERVRHGDPDSGLCLDYGPDNADYALVVNKSGRLVRYARIIHTGCVLIDPNAPPYEMNVAIPLVDERKVAGLRVGVATHFEITALLGAARRADILDSGGFRIVWGPQEDDWVFEFHPDGILAGPPEHRIRPQAKYALGVR